MHACLGQLDFLGEEHRRLDEVIAKEALTSEDIRRLLTVPAVNLATAAAFMAAAGDIRRFRTPRVPDQLPPSGPKRPTVRPVCCKPRRHLQAGLCRRSPRPGRIRLDHRPFSWAPTRHWPASITT
jgi:hypothetical protein